RNGLIRGTSRREDAAFWILQLTHPDGDEDEADGARFLARFDKNRNATDGECPPIEWTFRRGEGGRTAVTWRHVSVLEKFREWLENGLTRATDIAIEMGVSKGRVSQLAKIAIEQGWVRKDGHDYVLLGKP